MGTPRHELQAHIEELYKDLHETQGQLTEARRQIARLELERDHHQKWGAKLLEVINATNAFQKRIMEQAHDEKTGIKTPQSAEPEDETAFLLNALEQAIEARKEDAVPPGEPESFPLPNIVKRGPRIPA
jgi:hypothetical protein